MPTQKNNFKITNREKDVLEILWNSDKPLLASDITKLDPSLSISSVQKLSSDTQQGRFSHQ